MEIEQSTYTLPRVSLEHLGLARGMLARGDDPVDVAACLGLPPLLIAVIQRGGALPSIAPAPATALPPQAAYAKHPAAAEALRRLEQAEGDLRDTGLRSRHLLH